MQIRQVKKIVPGRKRLSRPDAEFIATSFKVGRFTVNMTLLLDVPPGTAGQANIQWTPDVPQRGEITSDDLRHYRKMRNRFHQRWADITGQTVAIVDV